ncbi:GDP-mannose-dependent alpha-(1-6)-phosphatidylinositol monomannoside mannosyltransferase [Novipirellula aureliae]|uniref:GDP-mannose-dependent alpha-(1-6)-phosphatidylinositol monomannoside mannosyltransferase n=1 Tax=Novipirellula aureliae TaxID=2527966 RepID=A0A5C6DPN1_9BACT|nr:glycosyltransferase [Novipirellula aureliae]TWU37601.1 GDP-mannose-dependent alpha-(1-6)-phosphatidylinositol monomannoside mannosyltransferase [Novipirellula aureliae]
MKVALAHHWIASYRGGERVLEQIAALFPDSDIYTLIQNPHVEVPGLAGRRILSSPIRFFPAATKLYRHLIPVHPFAIKRLIVPNNTDLLVSSDASLIKGLTLSPETKHVCYCHSPPRYLWELGEAYKKDSLAARIALDRFAPKLRRFDFEAAQRVNHFIANSKFVADRIAQYYQRESEVIYPPVAVDDFQSDRNREPFSLVISELVSYKRIDLAVRAFNQLGERLVVIGDGSERKKLEQLAKPNIEFLGRQPFSVLKQHYETASAFIFPGIEDFGITPVEAQASGCPVIAFRAGGALETVIEGKTGIFFDAQQPESLAAAVNELGQAAISPLDCRANAERFSASIFRQNLRDALVRYGVSQSAV